MRVSRVVHVCGFQRRDSHRRHLGNRGLRRQPSCELLVSAGVRGNRTARDDMQFYKVITGTNCAIDCDATEVLPLTNAGTSLWCGSRSGVTCQVN